MADRVESSANRTETRIDFGPPAAGVTAAILVSGWACFHSMRLMTPATLLGFALMYAVLAVVASTAVLITVHLLSPGSRELCLRHSCLGSLVIAAWAPAFVLHAQKGSSWMLLPAGLGAILWTIATRSHAAAVSGRPYTRLSVAPPTAGILSAPELMVWSSTARETFSASLLLQSGAALAFAGEPVWAMGPTILASTLLVGAWYDVKAVAAESCLEVRDCAPYALLLCAAAVLVTAVALLPHLQTRMATNGSGAEQARAEPPLPQPLQNGKHVVDNDVHQGVILWPEEQRKITFVPPLPTMGPNLGRNRPTDPLSIPFFGAYWIYRAPYSQPPPGSLVLRGSPLERKLHSTDRVRLKMEARQNLGTFFPVTCCGSIQVLTTNGDWYGGTIALELLLQDTSAAGKPLQSLGRQLLPEARGRLGDFPKLSEPPLSFVIPPGGPLEQFDEVVVVFHLAPMRADRAARVSIDRFVLMPRGH